MRRRRAVVVFIVGTIIVALLAGSMPRLIQESISKPSSTATMQDKRVDGSENNGSAQDALTTLEVKGRAPKTGYARAQFGDGWDSIAGCSTRNIILHRDLQNPVVDDTCKVISGTLVDPYSAEIVLFTKEKSADVQIDHVVALSDAWQKGAQNLPKETRIRLANDPLELLAVSGTQNQAKSDGDAASWLPKNKAFRCEYIARQIAVKKKYNLWVTQAEKDAMASVLGACPAQQLP